MDRIRVISVRLAISGLASPDACHAATVPIITCRRRQAAALIGLPMMTSRASSITKAASRQTYYTIRFLVDRERVDDAYRAYAYFRWVDDILDAAGGSRSQRRAFLERQKFLLDACYAGVAPRDVTVQEEMMAELIEHDHKAASGLQTYLRQMMQVMAFDVGRRGRLISQAELNEYTRWLATAVTEAMHFFIGQDGFAPRTEARYRAVSAAHIAHMLRDTFDDLQAGYYNVPREVLEANHIGPQDVHSDAYRGWVRGRVLLARDYFAAGQDYFAQVQSARHRLAGMAYTARFAWLLDAIEREGYRLRPNYSESKRLGTGLRMSWLTLSSMINLLGVRAVPRPVVGHRLGKL